MIYLLAFVVCVLAAARLTRLVVIDDISAPLRKKILDRYPVGTKPAKLITCYWCAGFWCSTLVATYIHTTAAALGWTDWQTVALLPLTATALAYAVGRILDMEEAANGIPS